MIAIEMNETLITGKRQIMRYSKDDVLLWWLESQWTAVVDETTTPEIRDKRTEPGDFLLYLP